MAFGLLADFFKDNGQGNYYQGTAKNTSGQTYNPATYGGLQPFNPATPTQPGTINPLLYGQKTSPYQFGYSAPIGAATNPNAPRPQDQSFGGYILNRLYSNAKPMPSYGIMTQPQGFTVGNTNTNDWLQKLMSNYSQYNMVY